jgi:hypothetical protein
MPFLLLVLLLSLSLEPCASSFGSTITSSSTSSSASRRPTLTHLLPLDSLGSSSGDSRRRLFSLPFGRSIIIVGMSAQLSASDADNDNNVIHFLGCPTRTKGDSVAVVVEESFVYTRDEITPCSF